MDIDQVYIHAAFNGDTAHVVILPLTSDPTSTGRCGVNAIAVHSTLFPETFGTAYIALRSSEQ
jgi:hypothetical protein